jgi:hypothetical protein
LGEVLPSAHPPAHPSQPSVRSLAGLPAAVFSGTNGGWGVFVWPPTAEVRVEAGANLTATVSFALIEIPRYG